MQCGGSWREKGSGRSEGKVQGIDGITEDGGKRKKNKMSSVGGRMKQMPFIGNQSVWTRSRLILLKEKHR